jgi:hypothetical protein
MRGRGQAPVGSTQEAIDNINAGNVIFASGAAATSIIYYNFQPNNFPNLLSWYSSDYGVYNTPTVLAQENQTVRLWQNKIGGGVNAESISHQPNLSGGALYFSNDYMSGSNASSLNAPLSYYVATKSILSGANVNGAILTQNATPGGSPNSRLTFTVDTTGRLGVSSPTTTPTAGAIMNNGANVIACIFNDLNTVIVRRGNYTETLNSLGLLSNTSNSFLIGSRGTNPSDSIFGSIYEILIYSGAHTTNEQNSVINYMAEKWGVTL